MPRRGLLDFTTIRHAVRFADVLAHYDHTPERHAPGAKQVKINCPFHEDQTPSCSINLERGLFNCFGCPAEGNVLDFIALREGFTENPTFNAAKQALAIAGLDPADFTKDGSTRTPATKATPGGHRSPARTSKGARTTQTSSEGQTASQRRSESLSAAPTRSGTPSENPVLKVQLDLEPEHPFLTARGVSPEQAETFGLGYCRKGIMRGRIAVPIHNPAGELVAYTGRYAEETVPEGTLRYRLPKGFEKSLVLFNLHRVAAAGHVYVVVVEGIWSVLRLHAAGIPAIALLGTAASDQHGPFLRAAGIRYAIVLLDGDEAGRAATPGVVHALSGHLYVRHRELPPGIKPDSMDEAGLNALRPAGQRRIP